MKKVIIAEKPSVAKNIADALKIKGKKDGYYEGQEYVITWAFGHLLQLYDVKDYDERLAKWKLDHFPFIPKQFRYKVKGDARKKGKEDLNAKKQLKLIRSLFARPDVDGIISACDYDREGQIIGDTIIQTSNVAKPVYRLLLNEWTPDAVVKGLADIRSNEEMKPLQDAGVSRQWADWVIGINLTTVTTLKYQKGSGSPLNIGRVLMPTLKLIYDRDKAIETFVPEHYYTLSALFQTEKGEQYEGVYAEDGNEKFKEKEQLEQIAASLSDEAVVINKQVEEKRSFPPYLFNLSNLQGYITSKYKGWTADKVLKVAQSLYEKKSITYPRTASVVLDDSLVGRARKVLELVKKDLPYENEIVFKKSKRIFDSARVDSHSAIIPTYLLPKRLTKDEELVYRAIKNRFIMQFMPPAVHEETKLTTKVNRAPIKGLFHTTGRVQLTEGWKKVEQIATKEVLLPFVTKGETVSLEDKQVHSHVTKPPRPHTEKTLLHVMETCGKGQEEEKSEELMSTILSGYSIGTPATRAETIKKLKDIGYIAAEQKNLQCTELGRKLVETFPVQELFDLEFTGRLEKALSDIEKRKVGKDQFLSFIYSFTSKSVNTIKQEQEVVLREMKRQRSSNEVLGECPVCGHSVIEGQKGFGCSNWKNGCKFVIWKNDRYLAAMKKKPTKTMVKQLLKQGSVIVKGLKSKKGQTFSARLRYEKNEENDFYSWKMEFAERPQRSQR
ncbi:DNA topoisomerase [Alkalihalobacillus oceani]|uniref:type IA DNA topoisomerase n=1 Tax=Halalkalibacter oceani TaxID=1653776 RepID=UPI002040CB04|nr:DNA topoisomerase [Halalkalibacter oceani]